MAIHGITADRIAWVRFYLEPVEVTSGDVNAFTHQTVGTSAAGTDTTGVRS